MNLLDGWEWIRFFVNLISSARADSDNVKILFLKYYVYCYFKRPRRVYPRIWRFYRWSLSVLAASFGSELTQPLIELMLVIGNINWAWSRVKIPELTLSWPYQESRNRSNRPVDFLVDRNQSKRSLNPLSMGRLLWTALDQSVVIPEPGFILTRSSSPSIWLIVENSRFFIAFSWNDAESLIFSPRKFKMHVAFSQPLCKDHKSTRSYLSGFLRRNVPAFWLVDVSYPISVEHSNLKIFRLQIRFDEIQINFLYGRKF